MQALIVMTDFRGILASGSRGHKGHSGCFRRTGVLQSGHLYMDIKTNFRHQISFKKMGVGGFSYIWSDPCSANTVGEQGWCPGKQVNIL